MLDKKEPGELDDSQRIKIVADTFRAIVEFAHEGGTFRGLIYEKLGLSENAYTPLYLAGGMTITNSFCLKHSDSHGIPEALQVLEKLAENAPMELHPTLKRADGTPLPVPSELRSQLFDAFHTAEELLASNRMLRAANEVLAHKCEDLEKKLLSK